LAKASLFLDRDVLYVNVNLMKKQINISHKAFMVLLQNTNEFLHLLGWMEMWLQGE
jgi:hypothetical protein